MDIMQASTGSGDHRTEGATKKGKSDQMNDYGRASTDLWRRGSAK